MSSRKELTNDLSQESTVGHSGATRSPKFADEVRDRLLTDKDVCALTGLDRVTLYRLRNASRIGFYKFGKVIRYSTEHVREFLEQYERKPKSRRVRTSR
jgi:excisionase family DNA binding protein